jgi:hypothetical protein
MCDSLMLIKQSRFKSFKQFNRYPSTRFVRSGQALRSNRKTDAVRQPLFSCWLCLASQLSKRIPFQ